MSTRNPMKDKVAIVGLGATKYSRDAKRSWTSLALEAAIKAIEDAGLRKEDIDGLSGRGPGFGHQPAGFLDIHEALGLGGRLTWVVNSDLGATLVNAVHGVYSGGCDVALVVCTHLRTPGMSSSARNDPIRLRMMGERGMMRPAGRETLRWPAPAMVYAGWAQRYMHDFGAPRETFGMISVNNRTNATKNEAAVMRTPITMEDYLNARMIRDPLGLLDMDLPVDAAEAMVVTTAERAKGLRNKPVYVHAATFGEAGYGGHSYDNGRSWTETAPWVAMRSIWPKSDIQRDDLDLFYPYDGFTPITISFIEGAGYCKPGEAYDFLRSSWVKDESRLKLNGKTYVSPNGGSMSHGRMEGFNYYTDAVHQLRGTAGSHQIKGARTALVAIGSFYHDPTAVVLRAD